LESVVLRLGEHVEAEHGLEQGRVPERERRLVSITKLEADGDGSSLSARSGAVKQSSFERIS
jgi:hypothetical protein